MLGRRWHKRANRQNTVDDPLFRISGLAGPACAAAAVALPTPAMRLAFVVGLCVVCGACGCANPQKEDSTTPAGSTLLTGLIPVVPMKLRSNEEFELRQDGTILRHGTPVGRVAGNAIVRNDGRAAVTVDGEGVVMPLIGTQEHYRFAENDDLVTDNGRRITIDDTGEVVVMPENNAAGIKVRVEGYVRQGKRAALLISAFAYSIMAQGD